MVPLNFSLVGPILRSIYQSRTNRILQNVLPLFLITFIGSDKVVKEAGLPEPACF